MTKILCFGDSITYGEGDPKNGGWADRLKDDFIQHYDGAEVQEDCLYNLGIGGETTDGLRSRFNREFSCRTVKGQNNIVIFSYGSNDIVIHKGKNIVPIQFFIKSIKQCIEYCYNKNTEFVFISLLPFSDKDEGMVNQHGKQRYHKDIDLYNEALKKVAMNVKGTYLDVSEAFVAGNKNELLSGDGTHPNADGHEVIYLKVKEAIKELGLVV
jgi:lysophospholipase L1-like esterase